MITADASNRHLDPGCRAAEFHRAEMFTAQRLPRSRPADRQSGAWPPLNSERWCPHTGPAAIRLTDTQITWICTVTGLSDQDSTAAQNGGSACGYDELKTSLATGLYLYIAVNVGNSLFCRARYVSGFAAEECWRSVWA
jgi:hypothetical protein